MLQIDIYKMRKLSVTGVDIYKLAPELFNTEHAEYEYQRQGGLLDFYIPEFEKTKTL